MTTGNALNVVMTKKKVAGLIFQNIVHFALVIQVMTGE